MTGGTGAIGGHVARWLAGRSAPRVVLTSRSGPGAPGAAALAANLARAGTAAEVIGCDVAERPQVAALLTRIAATGPSLAGVLHTAGALDDGVLDGLDADRLAAVLAAKAAGAAHLDELTDGLDLEQFVLFSSAAATFGGGGQGNYAAANAFLDGLAQRRAARGRAGLSVAWGPWAGGMAQASDAVRDRLRRGPLPGMDPDLAIGRWTRHWAARMPCSRSWTSTRAQFAAVPGMASVPFLRDLPEVRALAASNRTGPGAGDHATGELARRLAALPRTEQLRILTDLIRDRAAVVLGHASADAIEPGQAFRSLGFDSLTAVELRNHLATATASRLPATLLFDYPTPAVLAAHLRAGLPARRRRGPSAPAARPRRRGGREPVAIVAWAAGTPAGCATRKSCGSCWRPARTRSPGSRTTAAGTWTACSTRTRPDRARTLRPRGRIPLRRRRLRRRASSASARARRWPWTRSSGCCWRRRWEALERAGIDPASLRGQPTGVFVGAIVPAATRAAAAQAGGGELEGYLMTGNATSVLSGRVAYMLGLEGPAVTVDTACSSSLVALHLACQALRSGECTLALAGGVTVMADPGIVRRVSRQRGAGRRRAVQGVRRRRRRHRLGRGRGRAGAGAAVRRAPQRAPGAGGGARHGDQPGRRVATG